MTEKKQPARRKRKSPDAPESPATGPRPRSEPEVSNTAAEPVSTTVNLKPVPNRVLRMASVGGLAVFALIGSTPILAKLVFIATMALMIGTWRQFRISEKSLKQRWTIAFVALPQRTWKLRRYTKLETRYEPATGILEIVIFGPFAFFYGWISDTFFPWVGGTYQIWLNDEVDNGVLAWQGNSQDVFEENLETLKSVTALPVTSRS